MSWIIWFPLSPQPSPLTIRSNSLPESLLTALLSRLLGLTENPKAFRLRVVSELHAMGVFKIKGSVNEVAKALGVTRYTIYNYLDKLNEH